MSKLYWTAGSLVVIVAGVFSLVVFQNGREGANEQTAILAANSKETLALFQNDKIGVSFQYPTSFKAKDLYSGKSSEMGLSTIFNDLKSSSTFGFGVSNSNKWDIAKLKSFMNDQFAKEKIKSTIEEVNIGNVKGIVSNYYFKDVPNQKNPAGKIFEGMESATFFRNGKRYDFNMMYTAGNKPRMDQVWKSLKWK